MLQSCGRLSVSHDASLNAASLAPGESDSENFQPKSINSRCRGKAPASAARATPAHEASRMRKAAKRLIERRSATVWCIPHDCTDAGSHTPAFRSEPTIFLFRPNHLPRLSPFRGRSSIALILPAWIIDGICD